MTRVNSAAAQRWRGLAEAAVLHAGRVLRARHDSWTVVESTHGHDVKITADHQAEAAIVDMLRQGSDIAVFSEEAGQVGKADGPLSWVLDPLDGSANYSRAIPCACVSLALCAEGVPVLGVVYDFNQDELFTGVVGRGAWCNEVPMRVSTTAHMEEAILGSGFPVGMDYGAEALNAYVTSVRRYRKVRSLGSAALMLAYVACGRFDTYREQHVRFWDVAAGVALVLSAGGQVRETTPEVAGEKAAASGFGRHLDLLAWNSLMAL